MAKGFESWDDDSLNSERDSCLFSSRLFSSDLCLKCFLRSLDKLGRVCVCVCVHARARVCMYACMLSHVWLLRAKCVCMHVCVHACTLSHVRAPHAPSPWPQAPPSEYWSGLPFPRPGDFSDPGIEPMSPESPALSGGFFTTELSL